jgi:hypothetical protein
MSEKEIYQGKLIKAGVEYESARDGFQGVRCRVVTFYGSGSGMRVRILEVEEARRWKEKNGFGIVAETRGACVIAII